MSIHTVSSVVTLSAVCLYVCMSVCLSVRLCMCTCMLFCRNVDKFMGPSFETISGSGPNGAVIHYRYDVMTTYMM